VSLPGNFAVAKSSDVQGSIVAGDL